VLHLNHLGTRPQRRQLAVLRWCCSQFVRSAPLSFAYFSASWVACVDERFVATTVKDYQNVIVVARRLPRAGRPRSSDLWHRTYDGEESGMVAMQAPSNERGRDSFKVHRNVPGRRSKENARMRRFPFASATGANREQLRQSYNCNTTGLMRTGRSIARRIGSRSTTQGSRHGSIRSSFGEMLQCHITRSTIRNSCTICSPRSCPP